MSKLSFDRWQFDGRPPHASSQTSGLSFQDVLLSMHVQTRNVSSERRLKTPAWATSDAQLQLLLITFLEQRVGIKNPTGTLLERLEKAKQVSLAQRPRLLQTLNDLCEEYIALERGEIWRLPKTEQQRFTGEGWDEYNQVQDIEKRREALSSEIIGIDTFLKYTEIDAGIATIAAMVYCYYRLKMDSCATAEFLSLRSPHIRQCLFRLHQTANKLWPVSTENEQPPASPLFDLL